MIYIDVRTKGEYDMGHKDGAINHDIMDMMSGIFPDLPKDSEITLYCESGNRSMMAQTIMQNTGFINVTNGGSFTDVI